MFTSIDKALVAAIMGLSGKNSSAQQSQTRRLPSADTSQSAADPAG